MLELLIGAAAPVDAEHVPLEFQMPPAAEQAASAVAVARFVAPAVVVVPVAMQGAAEAWQGSLQS